MAYSGLAFSFFLFYLNSNSMLIFTETTPDGEPPTQLWQDGFFLPMKMESVNLEAGTLTSYTMGFHCPRSVPRTKLVSLMLTNLPLPSGSQVCSEILFILQVLGNR